MTGEVFWPLAVVLLLGVGALAGTLAGLLGVGGGLIVVPALYFGLGLLDVEPGLRMHLAVGTSLATIIPTGARSARTHYQHGSLDLSRLRAWGVPVLIGVIGGAALAAYVPGKGLVALFATVALAVSVYLMSAKELWQITDRPPDGPGGWLLAATVGGLSTMIGIGGGTFMVPILSLCGYTIHRAIGTAAGFGVIIAIPGALAFLIAGLRVGDLPSGALGYVYVPGLLLIAPSAMVTAAWGARLAHRLSATRLKRVFAVFLALTAIRLYAEV